MPGLRTLVHTDSASLATLQAILCAEGPKPSTTRVEARKRERRVKAPMPAEVQLALRRLLAQALVQDYLDAQKAVASKDGAHPPPDDNPKAGVR